MIMPSLFGEGLFDEVLNDHFNDDFHSPFLGKREKNLMKTDIQERDGFYHLDMDLPGFKKEEIQVDLKDGYLSVSASRGSENQEKDKDGALIRQERYMGQCSRSFYVGKDMKSDTLKARFQDGILHLEFPKLERQQIEDQHRIMIE